LQRLNLGSIELIRIAESCAPAAPLSRLLGLPPDAIQKHGSWLAPTFYDTNSQKLVYSIHTWVIRTAKRIVLFELGAGNGKHRPNFPRAHMLDTPWLDQLNAVGVRPGDVDLVLASHLHTDHVGWFTSRVGNSWVPTFPNARYIIPRREYENWDPRLRSTPVPPFNEGVIEDSVAPVVSAGQVDLVPDEFRIDKNLSLLPAPGHTMGHSVLQVTDQGKGAILSGDIAYSPLQVIYPWLNAYPDENLEAGPRTRNRIFELCANNGWLLMPEHFGAPHSAVYLSKSGDGYALHDQQGNLIGKPR
jgi:glyoxylase-like metal-dependent hydrolase (beta-lactamase superfamily II)